MLAARCEHNSNGRSAHWDFSNSVMAITAPRAVIAYGHRIRTEWERVMTTLIATTTNNRELTEALTDAELEHVAGGFGGHFGGAGGSWKIGSGGSGVTTGGLGSVSASISGGTSV
jgi:hypothetical protein